VCAVIFRVEQPLHIQWLAHLMLHKLCADRWCVVVFCSQAFKASGIACTQTAVLLVASPVRSYRQLSRQCILSCSRRVLWWATPRVLRLWQVLCSPTMQVLWSVHPELVWLHRG
jgi:hypothetical protein